MASRVQQLQSHPKNFEVSDFYYIKNLDFVRELGRGGFGRAVLLTDKETGSVLVDKITRQQGVSRNSEINCMKKLHEHPCFLRPMGSLTISQKYHLFMEYFDGTSLQTTLNRSVLAYDEVQKILSALGDALRFMHSKRIVHMDIKPDNVLINERLECKIIDFDLSIMEDTPLEVIGGTSGFVAPEVNAIIQGKSLQFGYEADYYSLGVTAFIMGANLLYLDFQRNLLRRRKRKLFPIAAALQQLVCPAGPRYEFYDLVSSLLESDPAMRLDDKTFLSHPFFQMRCADKKPIPKPVQFKRLVKVHKKKGHRKGLVLTDWREQFEIQMTGKKTAWSKAAKRLTCAMEYLEKQCMPPKNTPLKKFRGLFRKKKNAPLEIQDPSEGVPEKKTGKLFSWLSRTFGSKKKGGEQPRAASHGDDVPFPVEDTAQEKLSMKGFFKKKKT